MSTGERALLAQEQRESREKNEGKEAASELENWMDRYDFPPDAILTLAARDEKPETMMRFWSRLDRVHQRSTGRPMRLCSVMAASKAGMPHIHGVPQRPQELDVALLERFCTASGYSIMLSNPMDERPGRDGRAYVAGHLRRTGFRKVKPEVLMCAGIRTNIGRSEEDRAFWRAMRRESRHRKAAGKRNGRNPTETPQTSDYAGR